MIIDAHHHPRTADYAWLRDSVLAAIQRDCTHRPVLELAGTYPLIKDTLTGLLGGTAIRTYHLENL